MLWVLENTLIAGILALAVWLVSRVGRPAPVVRHGLWLVVLIKLITPPIFSVDVPIPDRWREFARFDRHAETFTRPEILAPGGDPHEADRISRALPENRSPLAFEPMPIATWPDDTWPDDSKSSAAVVTVLATERAPTNPDAFVENLSAAESVESQRPADEKQKPATPDRPIAADIAFCILLAGTSLAALIQMLRLLRLRRILARTVPAADDLTRIIEELSSAMQIRSPAVCVSRDIHSPVVCALGRAVLIWPAAGLTSLRGAALRAVIVHELAHVARRDHWIGWLELVAGCAWWWNPLFWCVRHQLHENAELACDAWATGLVPDGRRDYARALVDLAEVDSQTTAAVPALGVGDGSRKLFERRLVMILGDRVRYRMGIVGMLGIGLLALTALVGCTASLAGDESASLNFDGTVDAQAELPPAVEDTRLPVLANPAVGKAPPAEPPVLDEPLGVPRAASSGPLPLALDVAAPAVQPAAGSNDERLQRLEDKFDALLSELRELKSGGAAGPATGAKADPRAGNWKAQLPGKTPAAQNVPGTAPATVDRPGKNSAPAATPAASQPIGTTITENPDGTTTVESQWPIPYKQTNKGPTQPGSLAYRTKTLVGSRATEPETVALTRATYKLAAGKAEEIAAFLKANLTDDVDVRVKENALQVTATAADQEAIAHFVRLLQTRGAPGTKPTPKVNLFKNEPLSRPIREGADPNIRNSVDGFHPDKVDAFREEKIDTPPSSDNLPTATPARR